MLRSSKRFIIYQCLCAQAEGGEVLKALGSSADTLRSTSSHDLNFDEVIRDLICGLFKG